ncbi:MAG: response regulator [Candidatus Methanoperedens sp.]|nr:response regulator [Candidatus Methanoperedens sp.]
MNPNQNDEKESDSDYDPSWGYVGPRAMDPNEIEAQESKGKVLIVDDEEVNIRIIEAYLNKEYKIIKAQSGNEALSKIREDKPDLVLLDIMMPQISGYDVCKSIKENDATRFIPVVMITALSGSDAKIKAIEIGADDYLTKPVHRIELLTRIKSLLKKKYCQDELVHDKEIIEKQNEVLRQERHELEQKVQERTEELKKAKISGLKNRLNIK